MTAAEVTILEALPAAVRRELEGAIVRLQHNDGLHLVLALNYGGRQEILDAANKALAAGAKSLDEETIAENLYTADLPELDLMIRTSGESLASATKPPKVNAP